MKKIVALMNDVITSVIFGTIMYVIGELLVDKFKDNRPTKDNKPTKEDG
jgi:hypothetical protein